MWSTEIIIGNQIIAFSSGDKGDKITFLTLFFDFGLNYFPD